MTFQVGENVGRYRIVEQLGQGGMATVFKAYHAELDRYVALKVLHPAFMEDASFLARFQREARLVAKLDHPNIVPIYDYAEQDGRPYLVMKFIEGETLKARLGRGSLTPPEVMKVAEAVGIALGYAHKQGILHRDIKPSNVLLASDGQIYLADFGLARIAQSGESTLTSDMILGTPQYISPEQALGRKDLDEGTDIYSFGVMLYELVVGKVPFNADTPFSVIHDHIYTPLPLPRQVNPEVAEQVELVLLKSLSKERVDRFDSVASMVAAFKRAYQTDAVAVPSASQAEALPPLDRHPVPPREAAALPKTEAAATAAPVSPSAAKKTKPFPWMWAALAVIAILACMVVFGVLRSVQRSRSLPTLPPLAETLAPLQTPGNALDIGQAKQRVNENPADPSAHLQLALAYHNAAMSDLEQESVGQVISLAVPDEGFLWDAARQAAGNDAWLSAARLALEAAEIHLQTDPSLPADLATLLHETVYKAMKDQLAANYFPSERLTPIDEPLARLAMARYTFFYGDKAHAQQMLDELVSLKPGFAEAQLLQADFSARMNDVERARQALADLRANPEAQGWMLQEAEYIEGTLP
jgi:serine/threonine-protein kinase